MLRRYKEKAGPSLRSGLQDDDWLFE